jgi:hypothetical protein
VSVGGFPKFIRCSALKIGGLTAAMDQFASKWNCEELSIRYVSGLRNQNFFSFNNFREPCNHPNLYERCEFERAAPKATPT